MNKDYTHITIVMDRSGSMTSCVKDMEGGLNTFIQDQKKENSKCTVSFIRFDDQYEKVLDFVDIQAVGELKLEPRGYTALRDALGMAITDTGCVLDKMKEEDKPGLVIVFVITDGGENFSKEITVEKLKKMIKHQQDVYNWHFNYLGANQDSFTEASKLGVNINNIANYDTSKGVETFNVYSNKLRFARCGTKLGQNVSMNFTDTEKDKMV